MYWQVIRILNSLCTWDVYRGVSESCKQIDTSLKLDFYPLFSVSPSFSSCEMCFPPPPDYTHLVKCPHLLSPAYLMELP